MQISKLIIRAMKCDDQAIKDRAEKVVNDLLGHVRIVCLSDAEVENIVELSDTYQTKYGGDN